MKFRFSIIPALCAAMLVASSSIAPAKESERSAKASEKLARALAGRTAGPEVSCIPNFQGRSDMDVIDDGTLLFKEGAVIYLQKPRERCDKIQNGRMTLVNRRMGGRICSGDVNELVDATTGIFHGSCVFGPFVPYRKTI